MPTTPTLEPEQADRSRLQPKLADREEARRGGHPAPPSQARHLPELLRSNWRVATLATASIAALSGFAIGLAMPRGPVTAAQALALMGTGIVVGLAAGFILHSRWAMLLVPAVHVGTFELGRLGAQGPTVDGIHLDTTFGILGVLVSRGFYGLVGLLPMLVGVASPTRGADQALGDLTAAGYYQPPPFGRRTRGIRGGRVRSTAAGSVDLADVAAS